MVVLKIDKDFSAGALWGTSQLEGAKVVGLVWKIFQVRVSSESESFCDLVGFLEMLERLFPGRFVP